MLPPTPTKAFGSNFTAVKSQAAVPSPTRAFKPLSSSRLHDRKGQPEHLYPLLDRLNSVKFGSHHMATRKENSPTVALRRSPAPRFWAWPILHTEQSRDINRGSTSQWSQCLPIPACSCPAQRMSDAARPASMRACALGALLLASGLEWTRDAPSCLRSYAPGRTSWAESEPVELLWEMGGLRVVELP
jgi:hypothetical protein